jgi:hypothetical protein
MDFGLFLPHEVSTTPPKMTTRNFRGLMALLPPDRSASPPALRYVAHGDEVKSVDKLREGA